MPWILKMQDEGEIRWEDRVPFRFVWIFFDLIKGLLVDSTKSRYKREVDNLLWLWCSVHWLDSRALSQGYFVVLSCTSDRTRCISVMDFASTMLVILLGLCICSTILFLCVKVDKSWFHIKTRISWNMRFIISSNKTVLVSGWRRPSNQTRHVWRAEQDAY